MFVFIIHIIVIVIATSTSIGVAIMVIVLLMVIEFDQLFYIKTKDVLKNKLFTVLFERYCRVQGYQ